jgi:hypothetical protein
MVGNLPYFGLLVEIHKFVIHKLYSVLPFRHASSIQQPEIKFSDLNYLR